MCSARGQFVLRSKKRTSERGSGVRANQTVGDGKSVCASALVPARVSREDDESHPVHVLCFGAVRVPRSLRPCTKATNQSLSARPRARARPSAPSSPFSGRCPIRHPHIRRASSSTLPPTKPSSPSASPTGSCGLAQRQGKGWGGVAGADKRKCEWHAGDSNSNTRQYHL